MVRQPAGTFSVLGHSQRVVPVLAGPPLGLLLYRLLRWLPDRLDERADRKVAKLEGKLRRMVTELKVRVPACPGRRGRTRPGAAATRGLALRCALRGAGRG